MRIEILAKVARLVRAARLSGVAMAVMTASWAQPASAVPVLYTAGGTLSASAAGGDTIHLNFSTVRITLSADTSDAPTGTTSGANSLEARYRPSSGSLIFTNRPGGAPDLTISYAPDLITMNEFAPSAMADSFALDQGTTDGVPGTSQYYVGGLRVSFLDASFFPGMGPGPLPTFDVTGGTVVFGVFYDLDHVALYTLNNPFVSVDVVPEPGTALLMALGVVGLLAARRATATPVA
jgi:hypothetical protein